MVPKSRKTESSAVVAPEDVPYEVWQNLILKKLIDPVALRAAGWRTKTEWMKIFKRSISTTNRILKQLVAQGAIERQMFRAAGDHHTLPYYRQVSRGGS